MERSSYQSNVARRVEHRSIALDLVGLLTIVLNGTSFVSVAVLLFIGLVVVAAPTVRIVNGLFGTRIQQDIALVPARRGILELGAAEYSGVQTTTNGRVEKTFGQSTRAITVVVVSVFGKGSAWFVPVMIGYRFTTSTETKMTIARRTWCLCVTNATGLFTIVKRSLPLSLNALCSNFGRMAEFKSRTKSGTLRSQSEVKVSTQKLTSRNDYQVNLRKQNIILARGRDSRKAEKIVWSAVNTKLQSCWIKSQQDNKTIPYQRGAAAIARQIIKDTKGAVPCDIDRARAMIAGFYADYPEIREYVLMCQNAVKDPGWLTNPYHRRRRFMAHDTEAALAAQQREAVNFPIQSTVADAMNTAAQNFYWWRDLNPRLATYKILLAIHDAAMLEVPVQYLEVVTKQVVPQCMRYGSIVPSWQPTDRWKPTKPFSLDVDIAVSIRWGEAATAEELKERGVSDAMIEQYAA